VGFIAFIKTLPRFAVWVLGFVFASCIYLGDWAAYRVLFIHRRSQYVRMGGCARTGQCCRNLALEIPKSWAKHPWVVRLFVAWYRSIFNFHFLGMNQENWMIFECHYLRNGNVCSIYPYRPKLCREFPLMPLFGHGRLHKGCGFYFVKRDNLGTFAGTMTKNQHEQERREYLASR
jgi:Fe-S-cluster containining protein